MDSIKSESSCTGFVYDIQKKETSVPAHVVIVTAAHCLLNVTSPGYVLSINNDSKPAFRYLASEKFSNDLSFDVGVVLLRHADFRRALKLEIYSGDVCC